MAAPATAPAATPASPFADLLGGPSASQSPFASASASSASASSSPFADLLGFGMPELHRLGLLVLGQRGKLKKLESELEDDEFAMMLMALRVSLILCHARKDPDAESLQLQSDEHKHRITLNASETWVQEFPQSAHLLKQESASWVKAPWAFEFVTKP